MSLKRFDVCWRKGYRREDRGAISEVKGESGVLNTYWLNSRASQWDCVLLNLLDLKGGHSLEWEDEGKWKNVDRTLLFPSPLSTSLGFSWRYEALPSDYISASGLAQRLLLTDLSFFVSCLSFPWATGTVFCALAQVSCNSGPKHLNLPSFVIVASHRFWKFLQLLNCFLLWSFPNIFQRRIAHSWWIFCFWNELGLVKMDNVSHSFSLL